MSDEIFNKQDADEIVINNLLRTIGELRGVDMSKIIKSTDGKFYRVHKFEELTAEEVSQEIAERQEELKQLESVAPSNETAAPAEPEQPADQLATDPAPADTPAQPAEQPANDQATATDSAPADQPANGGEQPANSDLTLQ